MNYQALYDEITGIAALSDYVVTNDMPKQDAYEKDLFIADYLNAGQTVIVDKFIDEALFLDKFGAFEADKTLSKLDTLALGNSVLRRALRSFYSDRGLNFGSEQFRTMIDMLIDDSNPTVMLSTDEATRIKQLAEVPRSVSAADVSIALRGNAEYRPFRG